MTLFLQILIDGFAISALYGLGAVGFTLMFGVSGVLNLAHGGTMLSAAVVAWYTADLIGGGAGPYGGALCGLAAGIAVAFITYFANGPPHPAQPGHPAGGEGDLRPHRHPALGHHDPGSRRLLDHHQPPTPSAPSSAASSTSAASAHRANELLTALLCWSAIGVLWLLINRTRTGKALLAASINPRGLTLLGYELSSIYLLVWAIYGVLAGVAGVLLGAFLGVSSDNAGTLTASAFSIVVLGGLGSVSGSLVAAYAVGYLETVTAYLVDPSLRTIPALLLLIAVVYVRPQGLLGRR